MRGLDHSGGSTTHSREQDIAGHLKQVVAEPRRRFDAGRLRCARHREADDEAALAELRSRLAGKQRVAAGVPAVQEALVERRVETLMLRGDYADPDNRREALVQTAILQDADVRIYDQPEELPPPRPIAALLRF